MPRQPRLKTPELDTCYHVRSRVAGSRHWYPLQDCLLPSVPGSPSPVVP